MSWHDDARHRKLRAAIVGGVPVQRETAPELRVPQTPEPDRAKTMRLVVDRLVVDRVVTS